MSAIEPSAPEAGPSGGAAAPWVRSAKPSRRWTLFGAAAAITVLVVVAGLYAGGLGPFARSPGPPSGPESFSQAEAVGASAVSGYDGGGWSLIAAASAVVRQPESIPLLAVETAIQPYLGSCSLHWLTSAASLLVPSLSGRSDTGFSPFWVLVYRNASISGTGVLVVTVSNGTAQPTALLPTTAGCATDGELASFVAPISSSVLDSPKVLVAAGAAGGSQFLSAHPLANVTYAINGAFNLFTLSTASTWSVTYSTCPLLGPTTVPEPRFNATVNALTGTVLFSQTLSVNCTALGSTPNRAPTYTLSSSLSWSSASVVHSASVYWTNVSVRSATSGIAFGNLTISVSGPNGISPTSAWSLQAVTAAGAPLAVYNLTTFQCIAGAGVAISAGDVLTLFSSTSSLAGGSITVIGTGQWVGVEQIAIT